MKWQLWLMQGSNGNGRKRSGANGNIFWCIFLVFSFIFYVCLNCRCLYLSIIKLFFMSLFLLELLLHAHTHRNENNKFRFFIWFCNRIVMKFHNSYYLCNLHQYGNDCNIFQMTHYIYPKNYSQYILKIIRIIKTNHINHQ